MNDTTANEFTQELRDRAHYLRFSAIESLETHLLALETNLIDHKVNVRWAQDEESLCNSIIELLPRKQYNSVCFDMPVVPESLLHKNDNVLNIKSVEAVSNHDNEVETLIVNADFAIAENGSLVFLNRPSKDCFNLVNNLIVVVNIEQIIVSQNDLSLFLKLKSKKDETFPSDVKIISGSYKKILPDEFISSESVGFTEEPVNVSVILYENNISGILVDASLRQSLYCIHCGRCVEVCPVAKLSSNVSPIDIVKRNCFDQYNRTQSIFQQTTLCGNCQEVCPVGVPLTDLLIYEMNLVNGNVNCAKSKKLFSIMSKRGKLNKFNSRFMRWFFVKRFFGKNKMLSDYLDGQKSTFYNITRNIPEKEEENGGLEL